MNTLRIFISEFWPIFAVCAVVFPMLCVGRAVSLGRSISLVSPRAVVELTTFCREDQRRLFDAADRKAFARWRSGVLGLLYSVWVSVSVAAGQTVAKSGTSGDSFWANAGVNLAFLVVGW